MTDIKENLLSDLLIWRSNKEKLSLQQENIRIVSVLMCIDCKGAKESVNVHAEYRGKHICNCEFKFV